MAYASSACGDAASPAPVHPTAPAPTIATPRSLTVVASAARADWPCGMDVLHSDDALDEITFTYDGPAECLLPVDAQSDGTVGCPTRARNVAVRSGRWLDRTFAYDSAGRLVERGDPQFRRTYEWAEQQLVSVSYIVGDHPPFRLRYVESDGAVTLVEDAPEGPKTAMEMRFAADTLVHVDLPSRGASMALTWDGPRLTRLDWRHGDADTYYRVLYDCDL